MVKLFKKFMKLYRQDSKVLYAMTFRSAFYLSGLVLGAYLSRDMINGLNEKGLVLYFILITMLGVAFAVVAAIHTTVSFHELRNGKISLND